ncbi:MAG: AMP-binding protein [Sphingomonadaceae bacterium]|nr:AMP-binding protein [Sphingomonadaceae bacterium]
MTTEPVDTFIRDRLPPADQQPEFLFDLPEFDYPERLNAAVELIDKGDPNALAVLNDSGSWTYRQMSDWSDRIARLLAEDEALVPGNRVLLRGPNCATMFAAWLGILKAGGVVVATMPILRAGEIRTIIDRAEVSHAIVDSRYLDDYRSAAGSAAKTPKLVTYDGDSGGELEDRLRRVAPGFKAVETHRDDVALVAFTSGTTGRAKGCVQFHRDVLIPADGFARHILQPQPGDRWACSAPIAFTFGLGMLLIFPWRFGGTAVTVEQPGPRALLEAVEKYRVTTLATAPTAYKVMTGIVDEHDISTLRTCVSAGEHLPVATWHAWHEATGHRLIDGIGATEMMHIFISASGDAIRPGSTGKAVPGYRTAVLDEDNAFRPSGSGRLAVKGPTGCRYFDDERQRDYVVAGWNITGDTFRIDDDGYCWFVARSDDMIISSGYNVAAPEVENALLLHPSVVECAVVGVPCPERGQKVKAFVILAGSITGDAVLAKALQDQVKAAIAPYKYPREIEFVAELPKTLTGKLQRFALRHKASS